MLSTEVHEVRVDILRYLRTELCPSSCILFSSSSEIQTLEDEALSNSLRESCQLLVEPEFVDMETIAGIQHPELNP